MLLPNSLTGRASVAAGFLLTVLVTAVLQAENWPQWRGPRLNNISGEKNLPATWSQTENVAWRLPLPGQAGSSPVVWGNRVFVTSVEGEKLLLICISTDGQELWRRTVGTGNQSVRGDEGNYASPSACTDGRHVWSMMGTGDIACYDMEGNEVWKFNLQDRFGEFDIQFGMASTPVLHGDRLYLQLLHGDGRANTHEAVVAALDKYSGETVWKQPRVTGAHTENEHSYASPVLYDDSQRQFLITHGADFTIAHDLNDGHEIWRCGDLNPHDDPERRYHPTLRFVSSPAVAPGIIVIPTAKEYPTFAIRPTGRGLITMNSPEFLWQYEETPDVPTPLIHGGLVYLCMEDGNLHVLEAESGEEVYKTRTHVMRHRASPVYADGKIYLTARDGKITVVKPGREFEIIAQNDLGEPITSTPAVSDGTLYLRSFDALWAIRSSR